MVGWDNDHAHPQNRAADWRDDLNNARNWSWNSKIYHTYIPSAVGFLVTFASTAYVPAQEQIEVEFGASKTDSFLPFNLFILGLAFGPVVAAPVSEEFGRRPVYYYGIPIFATFILGAGFSKSLASLTICRFFAGALGGSVLVVGFGLLADTWTPTQLPIALSIFNTVPFCGPAIGQTINSFVAANCDWPWTQWTILFLMGVTYFSILRIRETHKYTIIRRRNVQAGLEPVDLERLGMTHLARAKSMVTSISIVRPVHMLLVEPVIGLLALYIAFNFAVVYCFSASLPFVFHEVYNFGPEAQGLVFISLVIGYVLSAPTMVIPYRRWQKKESKASLSTNVDPETLAPERLLWPAMLGSIALPISFFWFAWSAKSGVHWICPVISLAFFSWGNDLIYNAAQLYLLETYGPKYGASASAANNLLRYILAAVLPFFMTKMYANLGVAWASSLFGFVSLAFLPIPWAFRRYGPWLRVHSKYLRRELVDSRTNELETRPNQRAMSS
ncbi:MAG: hypothetical protein M1830_004759 [Pleopsidium flavum]|nr:MAG: hypothetical protein M1830_004759 [Pleopsidium flavum]